MTKRPTSSEYNDYYSLYVESVPDGNIIDILTTEGERAVQLFDSFDEFIGAFRYADGKWTVAEVVGHMVDTERLFAYRALRIARADKTPMAGMDQNDWVTGTDFTARGVVSLSKEFLALRASNIALFGSFTEEELARTGMASELEFSVRALLYILAGHGIHHLRVLEEKYLL